MLRARPVAYWALSSARSETDLTGHRHTARYQGGRATLATMPNGDRAADLNGSSEYLRVGSSPVLSIPTEGELTWEAWIRPDLLQFPHQSSSGYVDWMGKCLSHSSDCEWQARIYSSSNPEGRCNRLSAYVFNPTGGKGSGADFQPVCGRVRAGKWLYVVGEYQTWSTPSRCDRAYPGSIDIWVNGVKWNDAFHATTGCMSQYSIIPRANGSPLLIGTTALDSFFAGAIGKVAIYDRLLGVAEIAAHYKAMTGNRPSGRCADTCSFR